MLHIHVMNIFNSLFIKIILKYLTPIRKEKRIDKFAKDVNSQCTGEI